MFRHGLLSGGAFQLVAVVLEPNLDLEYKYRVHLPDSRCWRAQTLPSPLLAACTCSDGSGTRSSPEDPAGKKGKKRERNVQFGLGGFANYFFWHFLAANKGEATSS